jgi:capsular polysaccharide biosynthesis protein
LYISRNKATRRRLLNEDVLWPRLASIGFERFYLEDHSFADQIRLMQQASWVVAPHGAGLTNALFCPAGTTVVEIADPAFPNPNFYAMCAALGHPYALATATSHGNVHPLARDLAVNPQAVVNILSSAAYPTCASDP